MYKIEKNIPLESTQQKKGEMRKLMESMEVGDSFFIKTIKEQGTICNVRCTFAPGMFSVRKVEGGFRCWKIK